MCLILSYDNLLPLLVPLLSEISLTNCSKKTNSLNKISVNVIIGKSQTN